MQSQAFEQSVRPAAPLARQEPAQGLVVHAADVELALGDGAEHSFIVRIEEVEARVGTALGVPVLREDNVVKEWRDSMDDGNDSVALGHGERAAGAEVVLHVNDEEDVVGTDLHTGHGNRFILFVAYGRRHVGTEQAFSIGTA